MDKLHKPFRGMEYLGTIEFAAAASQQIDLSDFEEKDVYEIYLDVAAGTGVSLRGSINGIATNTYNWATTKAGTRTASTGFGTFQYNTLEASTMVFAGKLSFIREPINGNVLLSFDGAMTGNKMIKATATESSASRINTIELFATSGNMSIGRAIVYGGRK